MPYRFVGVGLEKLRDVGELVLARDDGQLDAQGVELPGVLVERSGRGCRRCSIAARGRRRRRRARSRVPARRCRASRPAGRWPRPPAAASTAPRSTSARLWPGLGDGVEHRGRASPGPTAPRSRRPPPRCSRPGPRRRRRPRRSSRSSPACPVGTPAAPAEDLDDLERSGHPRRIGLVRGVDQDQPAHDQQAPIDDGHQDRRDPIVERLAPDRGSRTPAGLAGRRVAGSSRPHRRGCRAAVGGRRRRPGLRGRAAGSPSYHCRQRRAASCRCSGVDGEGGPEPVDLAAEELQARPGGVDHVVVGVDQRVDQRRGPRRGRRCGPGPRRRPGGAPGRGRSASLRNRSLYGRRTPGPSACSARPGPRAPSRRPGPGVLEHGEHPLDGAVHRPAHDPPAGDRQARQVLGQSAASQQGSRAEPLDLDPLQCLGGRPGEEEDRPDGVRHLAVSRGPGAIGLLTRQDELPALLEPVDPAERVACRPGRRSVRCRRARSRSTARSIAARPPW